MADVIETIQMIHRPPQPEGEAAQISRLVLKSAPGNRSELTVPRRTLAFLAAVLAGLPALLVASCTALRVDG
jgi:hypothetical protein